MNGKIRKDLKGAFELAAENHPLDYYKDLLKQFEEERIAAEEAIKAAAVTPKKTKKSKAKANDDEDVEMADAGASAKSKTKKRKADEDTTVSEETSEISFPVKLLTLNRIRHLKGPILLKSPRLSLIRLRLPRRRMARRHRLRMPLHPSLPRASPSQLATRRQQVLRKPS